MVVVDTISYLSSPKFVYRICDTINVYLIFDGLHFSESFWQRIATHELSHALGYIGHCSNSSHMMCAAVADNTATSFSTVEKNHLKQIYNYYT